MNSITFRLAWRNLWRQPRRTLLTLGAMVFSNTILAVMISIQFGMYDLMIENSLALMSGHLQVQADGYKDDLRIRQSVADADSVALAVREQIGAGNVAVRATAFALASSEDRSFGIQVVGVQPENEPGVSTLPGLVSEGRYLDSLDASEAVVGSILARNLKITTGSELVLIGSGRDGSFAAAVVNVVGIVESGVSELDRNIAQVPLGAFRDIFSMDGHAHEIVIRLANLSDVSEKRLQLDSLLATRDDIVVLDWDELQPGLKQSIQADLFSAWFMYGVLIVLVAFSVLNTVLMSVLERTREFGIVMSLGLTPGRLGRLVILETAIMGVMGLAIGMVIGYSLVAWAGSVGFTFPGMDEMNQQFNIPSRIYPEVDIINLALGPVVVFGATLLASLWPALRLHWLHPVQAMRSA